MAYVPRYAAHAHTSHAMWFYEWLKAVFARTSFYISRDRPVRSSFGRYRFWRGDESESWYSNTYSYDPYQPAPLYSPPRYNSMCPHHQYGCLCHAGYAPTGEAPYGGQTYRGICQPVPLYPKYGDYPVDYQVNMSSPYSAQVQEKALYYSYTDQRLSPPPQYSANPAAPCSSPTSGSFPSSPHRVGATQPEKRLVQEHSKSPSFGTNLDWPSTSPNASGKKEQSLSPSPPSRSPAMKSAHRGPSSVMSCPPALPARLPNTTSPPTKRGILVKHGPYMSPKHRPIASPPVRAGNTATPPATLSQRAQPPGSRETWGSPLGKLLRISRSEPGASPRYSRPARARRHRAHRNNEHGVSAMPLAAGQEGRGRPAGLSPAAQLSPLKQTSPRSPSQPYRNSPSQAPLTVPALTTHAVNTNNGNSIHVYHHGRRAVSEPIRSSPALVTSPRQTQSVSNAPQSPSRSSTATPDSRHRWSSPALDGPARHAKIIHRLESKLSPRTGSSSGWSARANSEFSGPGNVRDAFERRDHFHIPCGSDVCEA